MSERKTAGAGYEARSEVQRVETVRKWEMLVPDILEDDMPVLAAANRVVALGLHEGRSTKTVMRWIVAARKQYADPEAWTNHVLVHGPALEFREVIARLNAVDPYKIDGHTVHRLSERIKKTLDELGI